MKRHLVAFAATSGCLAAGGVAGLAVSSLYAATVKPIYVVMEIDEITDADGFKAGFQRKDVHTAQDDEVSLVHRGGAVIGLTLNRRVPQNHAVAPGNVNPFADIVRGGPG